MISLDQVSPSAATPSWRTSRTRSTRWPRASSPTSLATLIYTSGTTGKPKGVRTLHKAWVFEGEAIKAQDILHEDDLQFLWLPMAHSFGKVLLSTQARVRLRDRDRRPGRQDRRQPGHREADLHGRRAPHLREGARPDRHHAGGRGRRQGEDLQEGLRGRHQGRRAGGSPASRSRCRCACSTACSTSLVFSKVRERFGGRVKFFISGSAALNADIAAWFHAAGVLILEGYGMTENAAGATVNHPDAYKARHRRPALPGHRGPHRRGRRGPGSRART
ncbi:AMP-binding protein [Nocardioides convexus]|uniref:AMP-binding protein n=1 Tax=Nocardioides convexus TaxID=2712224 RepID=UPI0024185507|nr:AMP-binding protein [Nocardioides convexus]